jgi:hypothetical protein
VEDDRQSQRTHAGGDATSRSCKSVP